MSTDAATPAAEPAAQPKGSGNGGPVLELVDVSTHYGLVSVLRGVNVEIFSGEIVCLLGGNASGKSTTMKTILGAVRPTAGTVEFEGEVINEVRTAGRIERGLAIVPENQIGRASCRERV